MNLSAKIAAAFAAVLAVCGLTSLFLLTQINGVGSVFTEYRTVARQTMGFEEMARSAGDMRTAALRFRLSGRDQDATRVETELAEVVSAIDKAKGMVRDPAQTRQLDQVLALARSYGAGFTELRTLHANRGNGGAAAQRYAQIEAEIDRIGPQIAHTFGQLVEANLQVQNALGPKAASQVESANFWGLGFLVGGILLAVAVAILFARMLSKAIIDMTEAMKALAAGRIDVEVPSIGRKDEVGAMAAAVQVFKENAVEKQRLEAQSEADKVKAEADKKAAMHALAAGFEASVDGVVQSVSAASVQMLSLARSMSDAARRASERSTTVAAASEEATVNVETVAAASEEMSQSIAEVSGRVSQSAEVTSRAASQAVDASDKVGKLSDSANTIGEVIKLISAIADQTNLLALNATIEAARAGEAGKGFAVVASEVKNLANQTAKATEQIAAQITRMQEDTSGVVAAIDEIGRVIETLNQSAASIAAAVEEQHAATQEIARNTTQAAEGTRQVSGAITDVSSAVTETGAAADQVLSAAQALSSQADRLRGEVKGFLDRVRAA